MRQFLIATTALVTLAGAAAAADLPARGVAPAPYVAAPIFSWTGFYIGVNGGYGGDANTYPITTPLAPIAATAKITSSGGFGGGQIGYNYQFGSFVAGLEADIQGSDIKGELSADAVVGATGINASAGSDLRYFGTARGRIGYAFFDRAMVYATGGYAYGDSRSFFNLNLGGATSGAKTINLSGFAVGAGIEYALTPNWTVKTEYLYLDFGKKSISNFAQNGFANVDIRSRAHTVKLGLNYKFSFAPAAVVAKY